MSVTEATIRARIELLEGEHIMLLNPFTRAELLEVYRDAQRYRWWRDGHAHGGLRPFLPTKVNPAEWSYVTYDDDLHNDAWMKATPAERARMLDMEIDSRSAPQPSPDKDGS